MKTERYQPYFTFFQVLPSIIFWKHNPVLHQFYEVLSEKDSRCKPPIILNTEDRVLSSFLDILHRRDVNPTHPEFCLSLCPYWLPNREYHSIEVLSTAIQFLDDHETPLPSTTLPPEEDVRKYTEKVSASSMRLTTEKQFEMLLDITQNNIIGAANLGFITSRLYARASDRRAYPNLVINAPDMERWNSKLAPFETYVHNGTADVSGDNYYFWSHFFTALVFETINTRESKFIQLFLERGTEKMYLSENT